MDAPLEAVLVIIGIMVIANVAVTVLVIRSPLFSSFQKLAQCALVWLIPVLGPIGIWSFIRTQYGWKKYDTRAYPEPSEKMVLVELDKSEHEISGSSSGENTHND